MILIALDLDGVINSASWLQYRSTDEGSRLRDGYHSRFDRRTAIELSNIDPACGRLIANLVSRLDAWVLITSTWRENRSPEHFEWLFETAGCALPSGSIVGCTPVLDHLTVNKRGHEIDSWIRSFSFDGQLIVLDDDSEGFLNHQEVFKVNCQTGITSSDVEAIHARLAGGQLIRDP